MSTKCPFCKIPCGNEYCAYSGEVMEKKKENVFEVNIQEAFEAGKLIGKHEVLEELNKLAIVDPNFKNYIEARLKSLQESMDIMKKYKLM